MRPIIAPLVLFLALVPAAAQDLAAFRAAIDARLEKHPFFTKIEFTVVDRHPPFLFYLQRPPRDVKDYDRMVVNSYLPFLLELTKQCEEQYWKPAGLARTADAPGFAVAILDSAGSYLNFRTAIGEPALAQARAHYTPDLRLAVTYVDAFAGYDTNAEERQALLHEFVHALQHAYAGGGAMPKPVWYNEGLADYRASSSNVASSLAAPPVQHRHVQALGFGYGNPAGRYYVAPLVDLVAANSYKDVLDLAKKRNSIELRVDFLLPMFYAQSEMFVRFLHEVDGGALRPGFLAYLKAVQAGATGAEPFQAAFGCRTPEQFAALEAKWLAWLDATLRRTYPGMRSLTAGLAAAEGSALPLSPPSAFDMKGLAFTAEDYRDRISGARRACAAGRYEVALDMLPGDSDALDETLRGQGRRARARVAAVIALRDAILAEGVTAQRAMAMPVGNDTVRGRLVRRDGVSFALQVGREERTFPVTDLVPTLLVREGNRTKKFEGNDRWLQVYLRWLQGEDLSRLKGSLALDYPSMAELRQDLTDDLDADAGLGAEALGILQALPQSDDRAEAQRALARLREVVKKAGGKPILQRRKAAIDALARAYAERAFEPSDLAGLGVTGKVTKLADGRVEVDYSGAGASPDFDFTLVRDLEDTPMPMPEGQVAYVGPPGFFESNGAKGLIGSGQLRWPLPLRGAQVVEFDFVMHNPGDWGVMLCTDSEGCLFVTPWAQVIVRDAVSGMNEVLGGITVSELFGGKRYKLRIEHDGKKELVVKHNGKEAARVSNVGGRLRGELRFYVHSSSPLSITNLKITGKPDPVDLEPVRARYVAAVLAGLWP